MSLPTPELLSRTIVRLPATTAPLGPPLPYSTEQWETFLAIADTIIPSIKISNSPSSPSQLTISTKQALDFEKDVRRIRSDYPSASTTQEYFAENASSVSVDLFKRLINDYLPEDVKNKIGTLLTLLGKKVGSLITTGYTTPFSTQPPHIRQAILQRWKTSRLPPLRDAFFSLSFLVANVWIKSNVKLFPAIGFPEFPLKEHVQRGESHPFVFEQFNQNSVLSEIETDVLVIGSGCGGGVAAATLSAAGYRVLVVDKGYHHRPEEFPMTELASSILMFDNGQFNPADDGSITVAAGSTWGGGGTINWSASLQLQGYVRKAWADSGLKYFESVDFQASLDRVCHRMGVSADQIEHNHGNRILLEGARRLGYRAAAVPQNTGGHRHYDGFCTHGCAGAEKMGPANSYLTDAARTGAKFVEGFQVEKILFENGPRGKTAIGAKGKWHSRDENGGLSGPGRYSCNVVIRAKRVILSAGSFWSPVLLLASDIKNVNIGKNFYAHPVTFTSGIFKEEVRPWEGGILTTVCSEFENLDGKGHGVKIEATCMTPSFSLSFYPWHSGADYKSTLLKYKHMNHYISIARDRDSGVIYRDPISGKPRAKYSPSAFDRNSILTGQIAMAKMLFVSGAEEIYVMTDGIPPFKRWEVECSFNGDASDEKSEAEQRLEAETKAFESWLAVLHSRGLSLPCTRFGNAHQMGTCRMGTSAKSSVVNPRGRVWGTQNLWVADASVFPSASGVNPMITVMAIADWISRDVEKDLKSKSRVSARL